MQSLVKVIASAADVVRPPRPGLVVLIYHRIGGRTAVEVDLPVELFEEQMCLLAEGFRVVTLTEGLELVASPHVAGADPALRREERLVAITFDDGTADFVDVAVPVLARHGIPATLYLATHFVETNQPFPNNGRPVSWRALREACSTGIIEVGSHTHSHALLDRITAREVADELDRSIGLIGDRLGTRARHFAYPKGLLGSTMAQGEVRKRFASAAVAGTHANGFGTTDPYRLARSPVQVGDGMRWFARKARGGLELEDRLRRALNRRRYRSAIT